MTTPQNNLHKPPHQNGVDMRGMLRIATMLVSLAGLTLSMVGAGALVFDIFDEGLAGNLDGLLVQITVLGLTFLFGWGAGLVCIRAFGNIFYPIIIKLFIWAVVIAICILYIKVIQKLYMQDYDSLHFWAYLVMLLGGLFVLVCLHLLVEDHDLRPFAIPLLIINVLQLCAIVFLYVFKKNPNVSMLIGDFTIFIVMTTISALMLMHIGVLSSVRDQIGALFNQSSNHNGNGGE